MCDMTLYKGLPLPKVAGSTGGSDLYGINIAVFEYCSDIYSSRELHPLMLTISFFQDNTNIIPEIT
eukprot:1369529-Amorphochlora_amoeboformis.AAC.1